MIKIPSDINFEGFTLIVPTVSVANVAQLCVDLLINNLNLEKIGQLWCANFIPLAGGDPYDFSSTSITTATEFYVSLGKKILVLQIRSPFVNPKSQEFFEELADFVEQRKISRTIILSSSYAYKKVPDKCPAVPRYLASSDFLAEDEEKLFEKIQWKKHDQISLNGDTSFIEGGGFAESLHKHFAKRKLPNIVIYRYCSEGDNVFDAVEFTNHLNEWLKLFEEQTLPLKYPASWKYLFGKPPPIDIY